MAHIHDDHARMGTNTGMGTGVGTGMGHHGMGNGMSNHNMGSSFDGSPPVRVFLRPIAPPTALGLAGFSGATFIVASWIAGWWGGLRSPSIFFPFVMIWGGLAQFIAGIKAFHARDTLATVIHPLWGSFYMSLGIVWFLTTIGTLSVDSLGQHIPELGAWMVVLMVFTWICTVGAAGRDWILTATLGTLALGSTIATAGLYSRQSAHTTMKAASYFWLLSSALAAYRVAVYVWEENHGRSAMYPLFRTRKENNAASVNSGYGEPGVKRGTPKSMHDHELTNAAHGTHSGKGGFGRTEEGLGRRSSITAVH